MQLVSGASSGVNQSETDQKSPNGTVKVPILGL